jgi:hypothetical protein
MTKLTLQELRRLISEAKKQVNASPEYMKKEATRASLQRFIANETQSINTDEELAMFFGVLEMSLNALKMVPLAAWKAQKPKR